MAGGPGKSYRHGITLVEAVQRFGTEEAAETWFIQERWPDGIRCPFCESDAVSTIKNRRPMPFRCRECRKHFSVKTNTIMHDSKLPLSKWALAFYLYSTHLKGVSSMKLHRDLGITQKTAWHLAHRIREAWDDGHDKFAGPVEVDETYIGGKESNKHESKKLRAGRGAVGKTPVVGMKDRETNQVEAEVIDRTDRQTLHEFVHQRTMPNATVYTDEARSYVGIHRRHESVSHSAKRVRPRPGDYEWHRVILVGSQTRLCWGVPPNECEAPASLCGGVPRAA